MDGKKIYAPTGFWYAEDDAGFVVINAKNGDFLKRIPWDPTPTTASRAWTEGTSSLGTRTTLTMFDIRNDSIVRQIPDVGEYGIFPYTVTRDLSLAFVCLGKHVGFDVVDLKQGKRLHRVFASDTKIPHRTHGAGLTPDQKELWISDQSGRKLFYFDATEMPPRELGHVDLSIGGHGWVTFSLDGKYAYSHAPDIFDARTKKRVGVFRDEDGRPFASSKFIEVHFRTARWSPWGTSSDSAVIDPHFSPEVHHETTLPCPKTQPPRDGEFYPPGPGRDRNGEGIAVPNAGIGRKRGNGPPRQHDRVERFVAVDNKCAWPKSDPDARRFHRRHHLRESLPRLLRRSRRVLGKATTEAACGTS